MYVLPVYNAKDTVIPAINIFINHISCNGLMAADNTDISH